MFFYVMCERIKGPQKETLPLVPSNSKIKTSQEAATESAQDRLDF